MANSKLLCVILVAMTMLLTRGDLSANDGDRFDVIDTNGDDLITPEELEDGLEINLILANHYVSTEDVDKDGKLNREEFAKLFPETQI